MATSLPLLAWRPNKSSHPKAPPRLRRPPPATEFRTCCALADTLRRFAEPGWKWSHFPAGEKRDGWAGSRLQRMGLQCGWGDYLFVREGRVRFLEMKRRGGGLSEDQERFRDACMADGTPYAVAWSYGEAVATLKEWGVLPAGLRLQ